MKAQTPILLLDHQEDHYAWQDQADQERSLEAHGAYSGVPDWICIKDACKLYPSLKGARKVQGTVTTDPGTELDQDPWLLWRMDAGRLYLDGCEEPQSTHGMLHNWLLDTVGFDATFWATIEEVK